MNQINLVGRITKDPELKITQSGIYYVMFSVAVDRGYKDANGEKITDFLPCIAWNSQAEFIGKYVKKGNLLEISGQLTSRTYQTNSGENRTVIEVLVGKVSNLTPKPKEEQQDPFEPNYFISNDDLPF